jgi:hypothetical protein
MLAAAKNYDVICLQMRNYLPQQEEPIKRATNSFIERVKVVIGGESPLKPKLDRFIPDIFNFRMIALKWIIEQPDIDIGRLFETTLPRLECLKSNPQLDLLAENALFAMRCNLRVAQAYIKHVNSEALSEQLAEATTYEHFFGKLALDIPDQEAFQTFADFTHASL